MGKVTEVIPVGKIVGKAKDAAKAIEPLVKKVDDIPINAAGLKEVNIEKKPIQRQAELNTKDQNKWKPAEAALGAQLEEVLGPMKKAEVPTGGQLAKNVD